MYNAKAEEYPVDSDPFLPTSIIPNPFIGRS